MGNLRGICNKINAQIEKIVSDGDGLAELFQKKSTYVDNEGNAISGGGGPKDFFRFLFDFVPPTDKEGIRSILERPSAGGATGQCWNVYPPGCKYQDPPKWDTNELMHDHSDIKLKLGDDSESGKRKICGEHLFPFTEGQLFWVLRSNAIRSKDGYEEALRKIQMREYAPVCSTL